VFRRLSRGHCGLYEISYGGAPDARFVDKLLQRDRGAEIEADPRSTALKASHVLGWLTRDLSLERDQLINHDE